MYTRKFDRSKNATKEFILSGWLSVFYLPWFGVQFTVNLLTIQEASDDGHSILKADLAV